VPVSEGRRRRGTCLGLVVTFLKREEEEGTCLGLVVPGKRGGEERRRRDLSWPRDVNG